MGWKHRHPMFIPVGPHRRSSRSYIGHCWHWLIRLWYWIFPTFPDHKSLAMSDARSERRSIRKTRNQSRRNFMGKDGQFKCTKCKDLRPVEDFGKDKSRNDGRARTCCHCRRVKVRKCWKGRVSTFKGLTEKTAELKQLKTWFGSAQDQMSRSL